MEDEITSALRDARENRPGVRVDDGELTAHVRALRDAGGALPEHLADVLLAFAASRGDKAALRALDEEVLARIEPTIRRVDRAPDFVEEVRQRLRIRLFVGEDGRSPRIADYQGRGPLAGWVRVAATRLALNLKRDDKPASSTDEVLGDLATSEPDPELRSLKTLYRSDMAAALTAALGDLPDRQRAVLRLHHVDGLRLAQIARLYQVHESTVSRWVTAATDAVAAGAKRRLVDRLRLSPSAVDSIARMVQSQLDLSIGRLLGAGGDGG